MPKITRPVIIALSIFLSAPAYASVELFTLNKAGGTPVLTSFSSSAHDMGIDSGVSLVGLESGRADYDMSLSPEGVLYVVPGGPGGSDLIYAMDFVTGALIETFQFENGIEGLAVGADGMVYLSQEIGPGGRIYRMDPGAGTFDLVVEGAFEIDNLVFDDAGTLIGDDINQSGQIFEIPLDGSQPVLLGTLSITPGVSDMAYSAVDQAIYFATRDEVMDNSLFRLGWSGGSPVGDVEFVKEIGPSMYGGILVVPAPSTFLASVSLVGVGMARRRR